VPAFALGEITTSRLILTGLSPADAEQMAGVLAAEQLYEYIGGGPPAVSELRERFGRQGAGSGNPDEIWLNWIVRLRRTGQPVGTMQATVLRQAAAWSAWVAWVIGAPWQGLGYASEAAAAMVSWLRCQGAASVSAAIHPEHRASQHVARQAGLALTSDVVEGEQIWRITGGVTAAQR
jgi:RimJ/RimL family protein N-acetyltransferase